MKNFKTIMLSNQEISPGYFRMRILAPGFGERAQPGQFVMFRVQTCPAAPAAPALRDFSDRLSAPRLRRAAAPGISGDPLQGGRAGHRHHERSP